MHCGERNEHDNLVPNNERSLRLHYMERVILKRREISSGLNDVECVISDDLRTSTNANE